MRLLKTEGSPLSDWQPQLVDHRGEEYAILSHRWLANANEEVLFSDIEVVDDGGPLAGTNDRQQMYIFNSGYWRRAPQSKPGFQKLQGAARQAWMEGHAFIWVDTCCIDKSSSAELSEAINSMWTWYNKSTICYAYLQDVPGGPDGVMTGSESSFARSVWWKRGWTLQELLAPLDLVFMTASWDPIGEKKALSNAIRAITGIGLDVLTHARRLESVSIAQRMSWVSSRNTTRIEDLAYCLMGIFSVNMPLLYGEGERSFQRLQQEIMKDSDDESIFAWVNPTAHPDSYSGLLAKHPSYFANTPDVIYYQDFEDRDPYVTSNRGLSISLHLSRAQDDVFAAALHCPVPQSGEGYLAVYLKKLGKDSQHYARVKCARLGALDKRGALQTIYVRQHHPTHELETVLPNHYFNLRRLRTGNIEEKYILEKATYDRRFQPALFLAVKPSSHTKSWVTGGQQSTYKIRRGPNKLSAVLSFAEEGSETWAGRVVILLGSISNTQVGYDAWETPTVADYNLDELEPNFRPRPADSDSWIELDNFHVKVDIEPQIDGSNQLFITDITISKINRVTPLQMLGDAVANHLEPFVPTRLPTGKKQKDKTGRRKVWQMLGRNE